MLPSQYRLTKEKDFNKTFKLGQSCFGKIVGFKRLKNNLMHSRFGLVVSNKVAKKAAVRNKIKRQLREIVHQELENIKAGYDFLIIALPAIVKADYKVIKQEVKEGFKKLKALE